MTELDQAIALWPNSGELLMQRISLKRQLNQPVTEDIRRVLSLDRANAAIRFNLAWPLTDLPTSERIAALEDAFRFDAALPEDEPRRLKPEQLKQIADTLKELK